jgi:hypothetical protein
MFLIPETADKSRKIMVDEANLFFERGKPIGNEVAILLVEK